MTYNPNQPRDPGGEDGGQWTAGVDGAKANYVDREGKPTGPPMIDGKYGPFMDINGARVKTRAGVIRFSTAGDQLGADQYNERLSARLEESGESVGYVDLSHYKDEVAIAMIHTEPQFRRKGIGSALIAVARDANPDKKITIQGGFVTPEGAKFAEATGLVKPQPRQFSGAKIYDRRKTNGG